MPRRIVIAGGGIGAYRAVEALRRKGYDGRLVVFGAEAELPYDRPPLSKDVLVGSRSVGDVTFRDAAYYADLDVRLELGVEVTGLSLATSTVQVAGRNEPFDGLIVATGATPRRLPTAGELPGVLTLRTATDAARLHAALRRGSPRVVVVGAGFIGSEVAASARTLGLEVTVVEAAPAPLGRVLGEEVGGLCASLHAEHGTRLICGVGVAGVEGSGRIERIVLADGRRIEADVVVVGVGVVPNTGWLDGSGLRLADGVVCDEGLCAAPKVYAIGDVARWHNALFDQPMRCEQWTNAVEQGRFVARELLADGPRSAFRGSNYFWSDQYGQRIQFAGVSTADQTLVVDRSPAQGGAPARVLACYRRGSRIVGAFGLNHPGLLTKCKLAIERGAEWGQALSSLGVTVEPDVDEAVS